MSQPYAASHLSSLMTSTLAVLLYSTSDDTVDDSFSRQDRPTSDDTVDNSFSRQDRPTFPNRIDTQLTWHRDLTIQLMTASHDSTVQHFLTEQTHNEHDIGKTYCRRRLPFLTSKPLSSGTFALMYGTI